jgi:hypothetical protein
MTFDFASQPLNERKAFLREICDLAAECARIFGISLSFKKFEQVVRERKDELYTESYWLSAAFRGPYAVANSTLSN